MKKKLICLSLVLIMVLSFASCSCFKQGPLEEKYDYEMEQLIKLPEYKNRTIDLHLDSLQAAIDTYLRDNAVEYIVTRGDDVYVDITVYKTKVDTKDDGSVVKTKGEKVQELSKANYLIEDLGNSPLPYKIETDIINAELSISDIITRSYKYEELEDYCPEAYEGQELYFDVKIMDKLIVEGDVVDIDFKGYRIDEEGNILKGTDGKKSEPFSEAENSRFFIGSKLAIDDFENGLINSTLGEEFSFYATFPDDYSEDDLKGERVIFYVTVKSVYTAPIYNDAFVKALFPDYGTTTSFEAELKKDFIMNEMFAYVLDNTEILEYPKAEYNEIKESIEISEESFEEYYGYSFDTFIKNKYGMTRDEYIKSQMKTEMVYYTIAKQEGIEPTDEMITNEKAYLIDYYKVNYMASGYDEATALSTAKEFVENLGEIYIYENVLFGLVEDFLYENAKSTEIEKTYTSISEKIAKEEAGVTE
ncbi:MAG: FKBP-type peptidyl-prolyl cis-trans isomerase [Clostridia bacterium]|nr:FKBP-type peptidyl-prolyl cis-trans isomerase [Clostridia bacterium]